MRNTMGTHKIRLDSRIVLAQRQLRALLVEDQVAGDARVLVEAHNQCVSRTARTRTHLLVEVLLDDRRLGLYVEEFVRQHGLWHAQTYSGWCFNCFMMIVLMKR